MEDGDAGPGDLGGRLRACNWAGTSLGPAVQWPQSLRCAVAMMLDTPGPACLAWGSDLTVLYNEAFVPWLGSRHPAALGGSLRELWPQLCDECLPPTATLLANPLVLRGDRALILAQDSGRLETHWVRSLPVPLRDDSGQVRGVLVLLTVLGECQDAEQATASHGRRMDPFLSVLSHEMRNPLAALGTCIESLRLRQRGNVVVQESAQLLQRQLRQLTRLVDDVLDVTRLQTGKLAIKRSAVDLRELLRQVMDGRKPLSEGERRAFSIDLPSQPVVVVADSGRLLQVFNNLLDNAVTCTREGGRIEMALVVQDAEAVVSISDDGIGLSPAGRERVFQWYVQEHPGRQGGLGIGLALVRQLVALQDGRVEVSSPGEGQGCRFSVCLPLPQELPPWGETRAQVEAGRH